MQEICILDKGKG